MAQQGSPVVAWRNRLLIMIAACGAAAGSALGQSTVNWQNPAGGIWSDAAGWGGGGPPGAADEARFALGGAAYQISFNAAAQVGGVSVEGDSVTFDLASHDLRFAPAAWNLRVGNGLTSSRLSLTSGNVAAGPAAFSGSLTVETLGRLDVTSGSQLRGNDVLANINGHLAVDNGGQVQLFGFSQLSVGGLATVDGVGSFLSPAEMNVSGQLHAMNGGWAAAGNGRLTLGSGAIITADAGEIRGLDVVSNGAQINLSNGGRLIAELGPMNLNPGTTLTGSGEVLSGGSITNGGSVSPGSAGGDIGSLFFSSLEMQATSRLIFDLAAFEGGGVGHDQVYADAFKLNGTMEVSLLPGFMPSVGATYDLLIGSRSGFFTSVELPTLSDGRSFDVLYGDDYVRLAVVPAPAPAAGALFCFGAAALRRRR